MFHLAVETSLFQVLGDEFLFSTFMRACFDFLAPPHATGLQSNDLSTELT